MIQRVAEINSYMRSTSRSLTRLRSTSIQRIESQEELIEFQYLAHKSIGVRFPIDFLQNSRVFAVFDSNSVMCGGFALAPSEISRVIESLPEEGLQKLRSEYPNFEEDLFESTALWLCRSKRSKSLCFKFWTRVYFEVVRMGRPHFIYAYSSEKKKLGEMYSIVKPTRIFHGFTKVLPGMSEPDHEIIEVVSVKQATLTWFTQFPYLLRKFTSKRCSKLRKTYH